MAPIQPDARRCPHCRESQGKTSLQRRPLAWAAAATTVLALVFSGSQLLQAIAESGANARAIRGHLETARALADAGDFMTAWESLERARSLDPISSEIGAAEADVAAHWLLEGTGLPTNWVPRVHPGQEEPETTPGEIADRLLIPLVTAATVSEGDERADLEALVAWCRYLRGRELRTHRRDIEPLLEAAREKAPEAYLPSLLLAYWRAGIQKDPVGSLEPWRAALEAERTRTGPGYTRPLQLHVLGRRVERARGSNGEELAGDESARRQVLIAVDEMRRATESIRGLLTPRAYAALYVDPINQGRVFSTTWDLLSPEDHLATVDWVERELEKLSFSYDYQRLHFIRSEALLRLGRSEEAKQALAVAREDIRNGGFRDLVDSAWVEMTGETLLPIEEWALRVHHLERAAFQSDEVQEALNALADHWVKWRNPDSSSFRPAIDAAIERIDARLLEIQADDSTVADLRGRLLYLRHMSGAHLAWHDDFEQGIRKLEALSRESNLPKRLRNALYFDIAQAYAYSSRALQMDFVHSESEYQVTLMYLSEGLDRLSVGLDGGLDDWERIEEYIKALRYHPSYAALSFRHHRVPPNDDE